MKRIFAILLSLGLLTGCTQASSDLLDASAPESAVVAADETAPVETPEPDQEKMEADSDVALAEDPLAEETSSLDAADIPTVEPDAAQLPTEPPTEAVSPEPEQTPLPQNSGAGTSKAVTTGAIPFSVAEGTDKWWYIDSTDSAYWAVQDGINAIRASVGLGALEMDDSLSTTASSRCENFVAGGPFDHSGMVTASEICARGPIGSAAAVCEAWKNSPDHYANIVSDQFSKMGVGCWFCSTDQGQYTYWVVTFE